MELADEAEAAFIHTRGTDITGFGALQWGTTEPRESKVGIVARTMQVWRIHNILKLLTESILNSCTKPPCGAFFFFCNTVVLQMLQTIFREIQPGQTEIWGFRLTLYDQEHLLSSPTQQGWGKSHHSRFNKWISSQYSTASILVGKWTEQNQQAVFCFVLKQKHLGDVYVCV